jgi:hypothetical protein
MLGSFEVAEKERLDTRIEEKMGQRRFIYLWCDQELILLFGLGVSSFRGNDGVSFRKKAHIFLEPATLPTFIKIPYLIF